MIDKLTTGFNATKVAEDDFPISSHDSSQTTPFEPLKIPPIHPYPISFKYDLVEKGFPKPWMQFIIQKKQVDNDRIAPLDL